MMKNSFRIMSKLVLLAGVAVLTAACEHKELYLREYSRQAVKINVDWSKLVENGDKKPQDMTLFYYSEEYNDYNKADFATDSDSVVVFMAPGVEKLVFATTDNYNLELNDIDNNEKLSVVNINPNRTTGTLYGGWEIKTIQDNGELGDTIVQNVTITPDCLNRHMRIHLKGLDTKGQMNGVRTLVRNVVNNVIIYDRTQKAKTVNSDCAVTLSRDGDEARCTLTCLGFDKNADSHYLYIYLMKPENIMEYYYFDIQDQMASQIDNHYIDIELDITGKEPVQEGDEHYPTPLPILPDTDNDSGLGIGVDKMPADTISIEL